MVEAVTDDGVVGLGDVADGDRSTDVLLLRDPLIGIGIRDLNRAERRCVPLMRYTPWGDVLGAGSAFAGVEIAMWDARGRMEGASLSLLLGGAVRSVIGQTECFSYRHPVVSEPGLSTPPRRGALLRSIGSDGAHPRAEPDAVSVVRRRTSSSRAPSFLEAVSLPSRPDQVSASH